MEGAVIQDHSLGFQVVPGRRSCPRAGAGAGLEPKLESPYGGSCYQRPFIKLSGCTWKMKLSLGWAGAGELELESWSR